MVIFMNLTMPVPSFQPKITLPARSDAGQSSLSSTDILRGQKTVAINHNGLTYKLQATRLGKLILTK